MGRAKLRKMASALALLSSAIEEGQRELLLHVVIDDSCGRTPDYAELFGVSPTNSKFRAMLQAWKTLFLRLPPPRMRGSPTIYPRSSSSWLSRCIALAGLI